MDVYVTARKEKLYGLMVTDIGSAVERSPILKVIGVDVDSPLCVFLGVFKPAIQNGSMQHLLTSVSIKVPP